MSGHHLVIEDGRMFVECSEPRTAPCHVVFDCDCEEPYDVGNTGYGTPYHLPGSGDGDLHMGRFVPTYCAIEEWFSAVGAEDLLLGQHRILLRMEWSDGGPTLHLPEPTKEDR